MENNYNFISAHFYADSLSFLEKLITVVVLIKWW